MNLFTKLIILVLLIGALAVGIIWFLRPNAQSPSGQTTLPQNNYPSNNYLTGQDAQSQAAVKQTFLEGIAPYLNDNIKTQQTAIENGYAIQSWLGDNTGGEALLKYDTVQNKWVLITAGGGIWTLGALIDEGVPTSTAQILLNKIRQ
jgi:hypothetical protein